MNTRERLFSDLASAAAELALKYEDADQEQKIRRPKQSLGARCVKMGRRHMRRRRQKVQYKKAMG